jgi:hypothetical protein
MGHMRKKPKLLPNKLLTLREFLNIGQGEMASKLESEILDNSGRNYTIQPARTSDYETGRREPNLLVLAAYARLGRVHLESIVDDAVTLEELRSRLGNEFNHALRRRKHKSVNSPRATAMLHKITRVPVNFDIHSVVRPRAPHLVCRYCKSPICAALCRYCNTPLYAANGNVCYLHANNGLVPCETPQVDGLPNRATPDDDNATYVSYRAELITDMTNCMFSYTQVMHSPGELLDNLLADVRHFADAHGLPFAEHERRSYDLYLQNKTEQARVSAK